LRKRRRGWPEPNSGRVIGAAGVVFPRRRVKKSNPNNLFIPVFYDIIGTIGNFVKGDIYEKIGFDFCCVFGIRARACARDDA